MLSAFRLDGAGLSMRAIRSSRSVAHRRGRPQRKLLLPALAMLVVGVSSRSASEGAVTSASPSSSSTLAQSPAASSAPASGKYPNAIAVLGDSGTTGYNSDPSSPGTDTKANSWAT